jgi:predicted nucleotidyltransferase
MMSDQEQHDLSAYIDAWRKRLARQQRERKKRTQHLRQVALACARLLVQDFGVGKVYLFGSLLTEELAHDRSDIDLAVEGLDQESYLRALRELGELLPTGVELDLVRLEGAWPSLVERVITEGILLDAGA